MSEFLQALDEMRDFMIVKTIPKKERQKLQRNLRVSWNLNYDLERIYHFCRLQ